MAWDQVGQSIWGLIEHLNTLGRTGIMEAVDPFGCPALENLRVGALRLRALDALAERGEGNRPAKKRGPQHRPVTKSQARVLEVVIKCEGDRVRAAKELGCSRSHVYKTLKIVCRKLGRAVPLHHPIPEQPLPTDRRGQVNYVDKDEKE
jgi:hypothetical protein